VLLYGVGAVGRHLMGFERIGGQSICAWSGATADLAAWPDPSSRRRDLAREGGCRRLPETV